MSNYSPRTLRYLTLFCFLSYIKKVGSLLKRPFPNSKNPHFQNEAKCKTFPVMGFSYHWLHTLPRCDTAAWSNSEWPFSSIARYDKGPLSFLFETLLKKCNEPRHYILKKIKIKNKTKQNKQTNSC